MEQLDDDQAAVRADRQRRTRRTGLVVGVSALLLAALLFAHLSGLVGPG